MNQGHTYLKSVEIKYSIGSLVSEVIYFLPSYISTQVCGNNGSDNYNFALLHLEEDFDLDMHINPICLPDFPSKKKGM